MFPIYRENFKISAGAIILYVILLNNED